MLSPPPTRRPLPLILSPSFFYGAHSEAIVEAQNCSDTGSAHAIRKNRNNKISNEFFPRYFLSLAVGPRIAEMNYVMF